MYAASRFRKFRKTIPAGRVAVMGCAALMSVGAVSAQTPALINASKADDWTALFERKHGWTGADGIFAVPVSGYEGPDHSATTKNIFVFSDTFIGDVDATGARKNSTMVHNSLGVLAGSQPDSSKIHFLWGRSADGAAAAAFNPNTPSTLGKNEWYWLQDGFVHNGVMYDLPLIVGPDPSGPAGFQFAESGIGLIKIPLTADGEPDLAAATQKDTPLFHDQNGKRFYFGCGVMPNTAEAGAPDPDGFVYVYGRNFLCVARVPVDSFEDFSKWTYWDGAAWNPDIGKTASLGAGGPELSVTPVTQGSLKGKYLLVASGVGPDVFIRIADRPQGPFGNPIDIYHAPEWDTATPIYTYNAKAHPSISSNGDWLVTYNVNTPDWNKDLSDADIYHPRFIRVRFDPASAVVWPGTDGRKAARSADRNLSAGECGGEWERWFGADGRLTGRGAAVAPVFPVAPGFP